MIRFCVANLFVVVCLVGCQTSPHHSTSGSQSVLDVTGGVPVVHAVINNPAPICEKDISYARLDRPVDLQVFVDVKGDGKVCKSDRF